MLIKLSTWSYLEIRMQDKITVWGLIDNRMRYIQHKSLCWIMTKMLDLIYVRAPAALWAQTNGTNILLLTAIRFLKFTGFGNYILNTANLLCPDGKWKLGPEWLFAQACKYIRDLIFKLYITMCKVHKAKEYSDVFCSVMINIQFTEFNSPPVECL